MMNANITVATDSVYVLFDIDCNESLHIFCSCPLFQCQLLWWVQCCLVYCWWKAYKMLKVCMWQDWSAIISRTPWALLALCEGNLTVTSGFPSQHSVVLLDWMSYQTNNRICWLFRDAMILMLHRCNASTPFWPGSSCKLMHKLTIHLGW